MSERGFWQLQGVADGRLVRNLKGLLRAGGRIEARIVAHLAELDARGLALRHGRSLWEYCQKQLGFSENQAFCRIAAARAGRLFPIVFRQLERGEIHLTTVALVTKYLTPENHLELLREVKGKSKLDVLRILARCSPKPEEASSVRKLAGAPHGALLAPSTPSVQLEWQGQDVPEEPRRRHEEREPCEHSLPLRQPSSGSQRRVLPGTVAAGPTGTLEPRSATRYRLKLDVDEAFLRELEEVRDLMSHANPSGDLAVVLMRALAAAKRELLKQRFGQTARPRGTARRTASSAAHGAVPNETPREGSSAPSAAKPGCREAGEEAPDFAQAKCASRKRQRIRSDVRRRLVARDGLGCSYCGPRGERCGATSFLQIHHEVAWAKGGNDELDNLKLVCAAHNRWLAELEFGARSVASEGEGGARSARAERARGAGAVGAPAVRAR